jgi:hypothetical protein
MQTVRKDGRKKGRKEGYYVEREVDKKLEFPTKTVTNQVLS